MSAAALLAQHPQLTDDEIYAAMAGNRDRVAALKGGLDWEMPGPQERRVKEVIEAVRSGELDEAVLDESVRRILRIVFKAQETPKGGDFDVDAHHELAHQIATEGMVLLKNNGLLPLKEQYHAFGCDLVR